MCRNIKRLRYEGHAPTDAELHDAALQFVRKISGFHAPSKANETAFNTAVHDIAAIARALFRSLHLRAGAMALAVGVIAAGTAAGQERKITRTDLPAAVERTVLAQSQGATVRGIREEKENGQTFYEVEMIVGGHTKDLRIDASGVVVEIEEQVALNSLPAPVRAALVARAGGGRITSVESITKRGRLVAYEAHVETERTRSEIQVGPDGKPLAQEP